MKKSLASLSITLIASITVFSCGTTPANNSANSGTNSEMLFATKQDFLKFAACVQARPGHVSEIGTFAAAVGFEPENNWPLFAAKASARIKEYTEMPDGKVCYAEYKGTPSAAPSATPSGTTAVKYTREEIIRYLTCAVAATNITPANRGKLAAHLSLTKNDEVWPRLGEPTRDEYRAEVDTIARPLGCQ